MVKKLTKFTMLSVHCKCGTKLINYKKGPGNRLLKIHRDRISKDFTGTFENDYSKENTNLFCPNCQNRIATVKKINGKYVNKLNQGQLGIIKRA